MAARSLECVLKSRDRFRVVENSRRLMVPSQPANAPQPHQARCADFRRRVESLTKERLTKFKTLVCGYGVPERAVESFLRDACQIAADAYREASPEEQGELDRSEQLEDWFREILTVDAAHYVEFRELLESTLREDYSKFVRVASSNGVPASDCKDVVQDAVCNALKRRNRFDLSRRAKFESWFATIVANAARDYHKRGKAKKRSPSGGKKIVSIDGKMELEEDKRVAAMSKRFDDCLAVLAAMEELSEEERRVLELKLFRGLTWAEVAREMRSTIAKVRRLYDKAIQKLRRILISNHPDRFDDE